MRTLHKHDVLAVCHIEYVTTEIGHGSHYLLKYPPEYTTYFFEPPRNVLQYHHHHQSQQMWCNIEQKQCMHVPHMHAVELHRTIQEDCYKHEHSKFYTVADD